MEGEADKKLAPLTPDTDPELLWSVSVDVLGVRPSDPGSLTGVKVDGDQE